jgi:formate hydrogenlyase transcriptional activator
MSSNPEEPNPKSAEGESAFTLDPVVGTVEANVSWNRGLVEHSGDLLCIHDLEGLLLSLNPEPARQLGYSVEELLRIPMRELVPPQFHPQFDEYLKRIAREGEAHGLITVLTRSGERRVWEYHNMLCTKGVPAPVVHGTAHDVTDRRRIDRELRKSVDGFRLLEEYAPALAMFDREMRYLYASRRWRTDYGLGDRDLRGVSHYDVFPEIPERWKQVHRRALAGEALREGHDRFDRADGSTQWIRWEIRPWCETTDAIGGIVIFAEDVTDITERKRAAALLEESEKRFRALHERAPVGIALIDMRNGRFLQVNPRLCEIAGRTADEMLRLSYLDITHPEDREASAGRTKQLIEREVRAYDAEKRYVRPDGTAVLVNLSVVPMWEPAEEAQCLMTIVQDITERKRGEEALRESEERMRLAQEAAKIGSFERNMQTGEGYWSPQTEEMFGLPPGAGPKSIPEFLSLIHPADGKHVENLFAESIETGRTAGEWRVIWPDGSVHWIDGRWRVFKDEQGRPLRAIGIDSDITERKQAEEALRLSEERFRVALSGSPIAVYNQDRDLRYTWVHNLMQGSTPEDFLGKTDEEVFGPETGARMRALKQKTLDTGRSVREELSVAVHANEYYVDMTIEPLRDESGRIVGVTSVCVDVSHLHRIATELRQAKERLTEEKLYLEHTIDTELGFEEIIGKSAGLKAVMQLVARVATSDATVLLLGETGVGKELVARAIHRLSTRTGNAFIKMNCAAIPSGLLESELFGAEKGAYTGSVSRKIGRLELADKGTIFLDEIGDIALALQPKLLRVLQDQEFERLGGTQTLKVDFRLIAATNRDLADDVQRNQFRSDLFYRLNVFPIVVPPLRKRRDDIPLLVEYFVQKCSRRLNKLITSIPKRTMAALTAWDWPGNVRELENFIERSVILTNGSVLAAPLGELQARMSIEEQAETLEAVERKRILEALQQSKGRISGEQGAAARLGLKRTTLQSKLKQLRINPRTPPLN